VADLTLAIELSPEWGELIGTRGQVYQAMERYEEAVADLTRAIELDPELTWAVAERDEIYRLMGRHMDATCADDHERALNPEGIEPDNRRTQN